ncbi:GNAT family N-acetyltransferase [Lysinibacillus sp. LZ02]|uniref:GNAT family N-acetyltransferase n=1 Tax=Lysinibacillus sp. LZ02 TaxID=3420668 RepID=UPI003D3672C2
MEVLKFESLPREILDGIQVVHQHVFEGDRLKESKLDNKQGFLAFVSMEDGIITGFKLGYEVEEGVFYSWLGGVHPAYQNRGIASILMKAQHEECKKRGYQRVRTYSRNERKTMLILNIKHGFDVLETLIDAKGRHKIVLEKNLNND